MHSITIGIASLVLALVAASSRAESADKAATCPDLSTGTPSAAKDAARTPAQMEADSLVAQARAVMASPSRDNIAKAIALADKALQSDGDHVGAYLVLARAHASSRRYMDVPIELAVQRAWANLEKARALEPDNVEGLAILADRVIQRSHDYACAERIYQRALQLDPRNARTHHEYAQLLGGLGRFELAFEHADHATAMADAATRDFVAVNAGRLRYMAGQYDWVLDHYAKLLESKPQNYLARFYRGLALGAKGQFDNALAEFKLVVPTSTDAGFVAAFALAYARAGQAESARKLLEELLGRDARGEHVVAYRIAAAYEALGEREEALRWLERSTTTTEGIAGWLLWLNHDPAWDRMREEPRYKAVAAEAGWPR